MPNRAVRLDDEEQAALRQIREATATPYDTYKELDCGPGGNGIAPSTDTREGVTGALRKKLQR
jgi:hypothetical protein